MNRALVIQRYVPRYRVPLFDALSDALRAKDIELLVVHGEPSKELGRRSDASASNPWQVLAPSRNLKLGRHRITYLRIGKVVDKSDIVVAELSASSLNMWACLARRPSQTILWGHGRMYVKRARRITDWLRVIASKRAAHVMTYSDGGRLWLLDHGVSADLVTTIGNSTDTQLLRQAQAGSQGDQQRLRERYGLQTSTALYVGGLDGDKRIPFLLEAGEAAHAIDPGFRLLIAGDGEHASMVKALEWKPWLRRLGRIAPEELAGLSWVVDALWIPGRVGLVAVDALALGLPILTTHFPYHAPEVEFLTAGQSVHVLPAEPAAFAAAALTIPNTTSIEGHVPSIQEVAAAATRVITELIDRRDSHA
jgi:glycosyltransferase involved in cell wall biosynthesis